MRSTDELRPSILVASAFLAIPIWLVAGGCGGSTHPPAAADSWRGIDALRDDEVYEWSAKGAAAPPFGTPRHVKLVEVAAACSGTLASAQWRQDTLLQFDATAHFDNCAFKPSLDYLSSLLADVDHLVSKPEPSRDEVTKAMDLLGRALHAIQDFYSHSNYVEIMAAKAAKFGEDLVVPVWTPAGAQRVLDLVANDGLVSGRVWWDNPKMCASTVKAHAEMAKDDDKMPAGKAVLPSWDQTGYLAAYQLAGWATIRFLQEMYNKWPALPRVCGPVVHFLPTADRRPQSQ